MLGLFANPTKRRGRRRARRNPLWRSKGTGRFRGRAPGRRLHRIRGGVGWHNPFAVANPAKRRRKTRRYRKNSWFKQPRRHRRASKLGWRRRRRVHRNPAVLANPPKRRRRRARKAHRKTRRARKSFLSRLFANNPPKRRRRRSRKAGKRRVHRNVGRRYGRRTRRFMDNPYTNDPEDLAESMSKTLDLGFWTGEILPIAAGGLIAKVAASQLMPILGLTYDGIQRHVGNVVASALTGAVGYFVTKDSGLSAKLLAGGFVASLLDVIYAIAGKAEMIARTAPAMGDLNLFGADSLEKELEARIMREVEGGGVSQYEDPSEQVRLAQWPAERGTSAFVTAEELRPEMSGMSDFVTAEEIM